MSAASSQESAVLTSVLNVPECASSGRRSPTNTVGKSSEGTGLTCPASLMSEMSPALPEQLTLLPEASPVSPSRLLDAAKRRLMKGGSGPSSAVLLASYDRATSSWKTCVDWLPRDSQMSLATFPNSGMTRNGTLFLRPRSVPRTSGSESSLWPTPVANDDNKSPEAHMAMKARMPGGPRKTITSLNVMVKAIEREQYRELWPTPTANRWSGLQSHGRNLILGLLNPRWVEWLMGFPIGWCDPNYAPSETPLCPRSRRQSAA